MARKKDSPPQPEQRPSHQAAERYLVVSAARRAILMQRLNVGVDGWVIVDRVPTHTGPAPLVVLDDISLGGAERAIRRLCTGLNARVLVVCECAEASRVLELFRRGAADVILPTDTDETVRQRVNSAASASGDKDDALRRAGLLRDELMGQLTSLCGELGSACRDLAGNMQQVALASETTAILRQELDLENLLRTALELLLKRTGPTNAAVFLPATGGGDYSLGAYANYDCPKDSAETMFDELAGVIGPRFEHTTNLNTLTGSNDMRRWLGEAAHWVDDSTMVIVPCRDGAECRAVVALFRDRRATFNEATLKVIAMMAGLIAQQLGRVVRTHNRHLPKNKWASPGETASGDDIDLAA